MKYFLLETKWDGEVYAIESDSGRTYRVELSGDAQSCSCHDWRYRKRKTKQKCKHMLHILGHQATQRMLQAGDWSFSWDDEVSA